MIKTKICGITNIEDAKIATELGAWAIGFIFYAKSPRYILPEDARIISGFVRDFGVKTVGVFVNEPPETVNSVASAAGLDFVQLHGMETPSDCAKLDRPFIKNVRDVSDVQKYPDAFAYLVDASDTQNWGGTGQLADWRFALQIKNLGAPLILSGGLSVDNIEDALKNINPDFIDVSSSLEVSPGKKNHDLMKKFFDKIRNFEGVKTNE